MEIFLVFCITRHPTNNQKVFSIFSIEQTIPVFVKNKNKFLLVFVNDLLIYEFVYTETCEIVDTCLEY